MKATYRIEEIHDGYGDSITIHRGNKILCKMWNGKDKRGAAFILEALIAYDATMKAREGRG